jgi:hypothetical protein
MAGNSPAGSGCAMKIVFPPLPTTKKRKEEEEIIPAVPSRVIKHCLCDAQVEKPNLFDIPGD